MAFTQRFVFAVVVVLLATLRGSAGGLIRPQREVLPWPRTEDLFAPEPWHNHGSCLVELPDGQLLACWFHGSGERKADDVRIEGARRTGTRGGARWSDRFTLADTPGYPDTNPTMFLDPSGRLWLLYPTILANLWESALMKYQVSRDFRRAGVPRWERTGVLHVTPGAEFDAGMKEALPRLEARASAAGWSTNTLREVNDYLDAMRQHTADKLYRRLGWMTRAHPQVIDGARLLVPLYHDGFSCALMALSDDGGVHWHTSSPLIGGGNIQPSVVRRRDGTLVAYMRDNGPPPKRLMVAESHDRGETWDEVHDSEIPNPGSGAEVIRLADSTWLFIGNDTDNGRHRLSVWRSHDEGRTWPERRALETSPTGKADSFAYPSVIQTRDGGLHATYSVHTAGGACIRHAEFNSNWVRGN